MILRPTGRHIIGVGGWLGHGEGIWEMGQS
jgi:hypothetical protein